MHDQLELQLELLAQVRSDLQNYRNTLLEKEREAVTERWLALQDVEESVRNLKSVRDAFRSIM